jgi:hypothetical protein
MLCSEVHLSDHDAVLSFGVPGFSVPFHERMAMLITMVGGPGKAGQLADSDPDTVANWRKEGARVPILKVLPLAQKAGVSMDWVATGYQVRPDLQEQSLFGERETPAPSPGFVQLMPVEPEVGGSGVQRWHPSEISLSAQWLHDELGVPAEWARYARVGDGGMEPLIAQGGLVVVDFRPSQPFRSGLYLVSVGQREWLARRLQRLPDGTSELVADALPSWSYKVGPREQTEGVAAYRIVWCGQKL